MVSKKMIANILYAFGLLMGITTLILSYTGLPDPYDTEPLLAFGLLLVAAAGIASIRR
jgi:hypothetical protein